MHGLRVLEQTNRRGELRIFRGRRQAGRCLRVRDVGRHLENFAGKMIDSVEQTASAGDENPSADIINERFVFDRTLELEAVMRDTSGNWLVLIEPTDFTPEDITPATDRELSQLSQIVIPDQDRF